jgi:tetratricopeptide (TPR) repeat protein
MDAVLARQRKFAAAGDAFDRGTALEPRNAAAFCDWGAMLNDAGSAQAETVLRRAIELDPASARAHMELGRALRELALNNQGPSMQDALNAFERAITLQPRYARTYLECARTMVIMRRDPVAVRFLEDALRHDPGFAEAWVELARLRMNSADPEVRSQLQGLSALSDAVRATRGRDVSLLVAYARALAGRGEFTHAADQLDIAIEAPGLTPAQREVLAELRLSYATAHIPRTDGAAGLLDPGALLPPDPLEYPLWGNVPRSRVRPGELRSYNLLKDPPAPPSGAAGAAAGSTR